MLHVHVNPGTSELSQQVISRLERVKEKHLLASDWQQEGVNFIPMRGTWHVNSRQDFGLDEEIQKFLSNDKKVLLLLGDSGAGKSLYTQGLAINLWKAYRDETPIPLWISLPSLKNPTNRAIEETFENYGLTVEQIQYLQRTRSFVFILDAYDEINNLSNLFVGNHLAEWKAKIIITCRREYLYHVDNYRQFFMPFQGERPLYSFYTEIIVSPFNEKQIQDYFENYNRNRRAERIDWQLYQQALNEIPGLKKLTTTPFILKLAIEALPGLIQRFKETEPEKRKKLTQAALYDVFIEQWFIRQEQKLKNSQQIAQDENIKPEFWRYAKDLAEAMHKQAVTQISYEANSSDLFDPIQANPWERFFNPIHQRLGLLRTACLIREISPNHYAFIHSSLGEYFLTRKLFEDLSSSCSSYEMKDDELSSSTRFVRAEGQERNQLDTYFNQSSLVKQSSVIQFFADRVDEDERFKQSLFDRIYASRNNPESSIAAANAITILNEARVSFSGMDFSSVNIPGADLGFSNLQNADLRYANLTRVNLSQANLKNANLQRAILHDVEFGEEPLLEYKVGKMRVLSPDKQLLAIADKDIIYFLSLETRNYIKKVRMPKRRGSSGRSSSGNNDLIHSIKFSQDCRFLAIRNSYSEIDILDIRTGEFLSAFTEELFGKSKEIVDFDISSDGKKIVISYNKGNWKLPLDPIDISEYGNIAKAIFQTQIEERNKKEQEVLDIFELETTKKIKTLLRSEYSPPITLEVNYNMGSSDGYDLYQTESIVHKREIGEPIIVKYSPKGNMIVIYDSVGNFLIWEEETGKLIKDFCIEHMAHVFLEFSSSEDWFIYGSKILKITDHDGHFLQEENVLYLEKIKDRKGSIEAIRLPFSVSSAIFNPDETILALACKNKVIILNLIDLEIIWTLEGHIGAVDKLAFSASGNFLASISSADKILRLWDIRTSQFLRLMNLGHKTKIEEISFYQKDTLIMSLAENIRFWPILSDLNHKEYPKINDIISKVNSIEFSKDGSCIVSGNENGTISLWQANTGILQQNIIAHKDEKENEKRTGLSTLEIHGGALVTTAKFGGNGENRNNKILFAGCYEAYYTSNRHHLLRRAGFVIKSWDILQSGQLKIGKSINNIDSLVLDGNEHYKSVNAFAVSSDSKWLAFSSSTPSDVYGLESGFDYGVELCSVDTLAVIKKFVCLNPVRKLKFIPDTNILLTATDNSLDFWDIAKGEILKIFLKQKKDYTHVIDLSVSRCGNYVSVLDYSGHVFVWPILSDKVIKSFKDSSMTCLCFSDNSDFLVSGHINGSIKIWLIRDANVIYSNQASYSEISSLAFNFVDSLFVTGSKDGLIICWKLRQTQKIMTPVVDMVWSSRPLGLQCQGLKIDGIVAASTKNKEFLHQKGALGVSSNQTYLPLFHSEIEINAAYIKAPTPVIAVVTKSIVDPEITLDYNNWTVSIMRMLNGKNPDHAFLIIEGLNQFGKGLLFRYDLIDDREKPSYALIIGKTLQNITPEEMKTVFYKHFLDQQKVYYKCWSLTRSRALNLINDIRQDQSKTIKYCIVDKESVSSKSTNEKSHSCYTWVKEKLHNLNTAEDNNMINLPEKWADSSIAITKSYIPATANQSSKCATM